MKKVIRASVAVVTWVACFAILVVGLGSELSPGFRGFGFVLKGMFE
jgi:hypothetical protein